MQISSTNIRSGKVAAYIYRPLPVSQKPIKRQPLDKQATKHGPFHGHASLGQPQRADPQHVNRPQAGPKVYFQPSQTPRPQDRPALHRPPPFSSAPAGLPVPPLLDPHLQQRIQHGHPLPLGLLNPLHSDELREEAHPSHVPRLHLTVQ